MGLLHKATSTNGSLTHSLARSFARSLSLYIHISLTVSCAGVCVQQCECVYVYYFAQPIFYTYDTSRMRYGVSEYMIPISEMQWDWARVKKKSHKSKEKKKEPTTKGKTNGKEEKSSNEKKCVKRNYILYLYMRMHNFSHFDACKILCVASICALCNNVYTHIVHTLNAKCRHVPIELRPESDWVRISHDFLGITDRYCRDSFQMII